jgi:uncharacterized membrane protein YqjE
MDDQASMKTNPNGRASTGSSPASVRSFSGGVSESGASAVVSGIASFGEDILSLAELQSRLAAIELRQNVNAVKTSGTLVLAGSILALLGVGVGLTGVAELLVSDFGLKRGYALLAVAAAALLLAGLFVGFGQTWLRRQRIGFPRSREELTRNLNWVRTVLRHSGRSPSQR